MKKTACDIFIENYVDENGKSPIIYVDDLVAKFGEAFLSNNGCQWARKGSKLDKFYILKRYNAKEMGITSIAWNRIVAVQVFGFRETIENHKIPALVYKELKDSPCTVLGVITTDMEIDHKNGKYNEEKYKTEDFQRLSKAVNDAKREHCKKCNTTGCRFKASTLGYTKDFVEGDEHSSFCKGCYWYDPYEFNKKISGGD